MDFDTDRVCTNMQVGIHMKGCCLRVENMAKVYKNMPMVILTKEIFGMGFDTGHGLYKLANGDSYEGL